MAASNTDKFRKTAPNFSTTVGADALSNGTDQTTSLTSVTNLPTDTAVDLTYNRVDSDGDATNNFETTTGVISGSNFANQLRGQEGTAQAWDSGTVVEALFTAKMWNDHIDGILVEHNQNGTHSNITATSLSVSGNIDVNDSSTAIRDSSDNELVKFVKTSSAVNEITVTNAATGNAPKIEATGEDTNIDLKLKGKGTGAIVVEATSTSAAEIRLSEDTDNGTNYIGLKAPAAISANKTFILPDSDGSANQYLKTDGSGNLSFGTPSTGSAMQSKIIATTRDLSLSSGDVSYTGVGFQPTAVFALAALGGGTEGQSWGMADSSGTERAITRGSNGLGYTGSVLCSIEQTSGALQEAVLKTYDADGVTLTWTKTGSPTGTAVIYLLCLK